MEGTESDSVSWKDFRLELKSVYTAGIRDPGGMMSCSRGLNREVQPSEHASRNRSAMATGNGEYVRVAGIQMVVISQEASLAVIILSTTMGSEKDFLVLNSSQTVRSSRAFKYQRDGS